MPSEPVSEDELTDEQKENRVRLAAFLGTQLTEDY